MVLPEEKMLPDSQRCNADSHIISVTNISDRETVNYSLVLIKGFIKTTNQDACCDLRDSKVLLHHLNSDSSSNSVSEWPVVNSTFKCLHKLKPGANQLLLQFKESKLKLEVRYTSRPTKFHVLPVYIICKGHDGKFQAPEGIDNSIQGACKRIALGAKLIQCLVAEKLYEANSKRKTFQLASDLNPTVPECQVFHSHLQVEKARSMNPGALWEHFGRELMMSPLGRDDCKFLAFLSCTRYTPTSRTPFTHEDTLSLMEAHVALGGGGLALFGTGCLYTWPSCVGEVMNKFHDSTKVDSLNFMDDSCYRGTYGGCFATTLGSVCHELGHTFDLGHSPDGIMGRGFDHINLVFTTLSIVDNNEGSDDGNKNLISPVQKEAAQHSTVSFTKVLNVSYTVSLPIKRPTTKKHEAGNVSANRSNTPTSPKRASSLSDGSFERNQNEIRLNNENNVSDNLKSPTDYQNSAKHVDDLTHWSESCSIILDFHRWFNSETPTKVPGNLSYNECQRTVSSNYSIQVVEVRDSTGLVLLSWQFSDGGGKELFQVPTSALTKEAFLLVAADSNGGILKQPLSISV